MSLVSCSPETQSNVTFVWAWRTKVITAFGSHRGVHRRSSLRQLSHKAKVIFERSLLKVVI
eukprot:5646090-Amphidinium_carterae.1